MLGIDPVSIYEDRPFNGLLIWIITNFEFIIFQRGLIDDIDVD